jgi:class 3 adenylate cyclase
VVASGSAECKQATVLFADMAHSMDIVAAVGTERLHELMTGLVSRSSEVVHPHGALDKFTGEGVKGRLRRAIGLGGPCVSRLLDLVGASMRKPARLAAAIRLRGDVDMQLRTRLNSRQVMAGDTGSIPAGVHPPSASKLEWPNACNRLPRRAQ